MWLQWVLPGSLHLLTHALSLPASLYPLPPTPAPERCLAAPNSQAQSISLHLASCTGSQEAGRVPPLLSFWLDFDQPTVAAPLVSLDWEMGLDKSCGLHSGPLLLGFSPSSLYLFSPFWSQLQLDFIFYWNTSLQSWGKKERENKVGWTNQGEEHWKEDLKNEPEQDHSAFFLTVLKALTIACKGDRSSSFLVCGMCVFIIPW